MQELAELVREARRFVLSYKVVVEIAPLQLHASATQILLNIIVALVRFLVACIGTVY